MFRPSTRSGGIRFRRIVQLGVLGALVLAGMAGAVGGGLDPNFGSGGVALTDFGSGSSDSVAAVALRANGGIVAVGSSDGDFALARYKDGQLDPSFGSGGKVLTGSTGDASGMAIQPNGKIVVVGADNLGDFVVARYNPDGSLDATFGSGGKVVTDISGSFSFARGVAIQANGKIVVVGTTQVFTPAYGDLDIAIFRYNADGTLDSSFGSGGKVVINLHDDDTGNAVAIQLDGKIVVVGETVVDNQGFAVLRYNSDGTLDPSFGSGGVTVTDIGVGQAGGAFAVKLQQDAKIVVAGVGGGDGFSDFAIVRYNTDGSLDSSFGDGGKVFTHFGPKRFDQAFALAIQPDGKLVAAGSTQRDDEQSGSIHFTSDFALARYTPNGTLDSSFGSGGKLVTDIGNSSSDGANAVAIYPNGKIVAAGSSDAHGTADFALIRYLGG